MSTAKAIRKTIIYTILFSLIPALLMNASRTNLIKNFANNFSILANIDIDFWKDICFITGTILNTGVLATWATWRDIKLRKVKSQRNSMAKYSKRLFLNAISIQFSHAGFGRVNLDAFVPDTNMWTRPKQWIEALFQGKAIFKKYYVPIEELSDKLGLDFEVSPSPQGVVGMCYQERASFAKCKNDIILLTRYQEEETKEWKYWICVPIFDKQDDIPLIISFNSDKEGQLSRTDAEELSRKLVSYGVDLWKELFEQENKARSI